MQEPTDEEIIDRVLGGDTQAFRFLVIRYQDLAYTVARKVMKNDNEAEEVTQESFIKAFQQLASFRGTAKFSTWLYTIAYRTAVYQLRKRKLPTKELVGAATATDLAQNPADRMVADQEKSQIRAAIDRLPKLEALVITLFYLHDRSVAEIATITDLSTSNIKVKLFRARKKLKKELGHLA